jgi:poly(3-hydroxybutyrate) depolymerase
MPPVSCVGSILCRAFQLVALACLLQPAAAERLPGLGADLSQTSVSGVSSGGYMAVQFHVAHSATVIGAGVLAAGPYYCAQGSAWLARFNCMAPGTFTPLPAVALLATDTDVLARTGLIDATSNLKRSRVWLFTGKRDTTVHSEVVEALKRYYDAYLPAAAIAWVDNVAAGHGMISIDHGISCASTASPYINDCHFDAAGELLQHIHGPLKPPATGQGGRLIAFDQAEFTSGDAYSISLATTGYAYVPSACEMGRCRVHVAFHGCLQNAAAVGKAFVRDAGYNRWAESNALIVLYPQTIARYGFGGWPASFVLNPNGCWDWWGYTGPAYHTRGGAQVRAVQAMLERLAEPR